jgi:hypothetical protein
METDADVNMLDDETPRFSTAQKGKGKASEVTASEPQTDNLPW